MNIKKVKIVKRIRTTAEIKDFKKKVKKLGRTFLSKFVIKLTSKMNIPGFYLQILKYEPKNRTRYEISKTLPFFETLGPFHDYINLKENSKDNNSSKIVLDLAWNSFYKYKKKMSIIKRANEERNNFYLILNGNIAKLNLIFKKEKITIEEYLLYMLKMKLLQENQILYKCSKLNREIINLDINNWEYYFDNNIVYNYKELKNRAKKELKNEGFIFTIDDDIAHIPSLEKYLKLSIFELKDRSDTNVRYNLFIGHYFKLNNLYNGSCIGDLSRNEYNEGCTYICNRNCDICLINKKETSKLKLYDYIHLKMLNIFKEIWNKFYILKDMNEDICINYLVPCMIYKTYKKGDKIFIQNSQYEGIYFIINGEVKINVSQTFNELSNTLASLQYSIFNFKDYVAKKFKTIDIINEFNLKYIINSHKKNIKDLKEDEIEQKIFSSNEYFSYFTEINNIDFYTLNVGDVLGLNELYDFKTELYNFNSECVSDEATLFFISKKDFNNIIQMETDIMKNVIQLIDFKIKELIGKINLFKNFHKKVVVKILKIKDKKRMKISNSCINLNENKYNISSTINEFNVISKNENKPKKISIQKNIKLFKKNELLKYLKNAGYLENDKIIKNAKNEIEKINKEKEKDKLFKSHKITKPNNYLENNNNDKSNLKRNKSCMDLCSKKLIDSNEKTKESGIKLNLKNKSRNKNNNFNKTLYLPSKFGYLINNRQKGLENTKNNFYASYSKLPLIKK